MRETKECYIMQEDLSSSLDGGGRDATINLYIQTGVVRTQMFHLNKKSSQLYRRYK